MDHFGRRYWVASQTYGGKIVVFLIVLAIVALVAGVVARVDFMRGMGVGMLLVGVAYGSVLFLRRRSIH